MSFAHAGSVVLRRICVFSCGLFGRTAPKGPPERRHAATYWVENKNVLVQLRKTRLKDIFILIGGILPCIREQQLLVHTTR